MDNFKERVIVSISAFIIVVSVALVIFVSKEYRHAKILRTSDSALEDTVNVVNMVRRDITGTELEDKYAEPLKEAVRSLELVRQGCRLVAKERDVDMSKPNKKEPTVKALVRLKAVNKKLKEELEDQ